jgi:hypothetical protein
MAAKEDPLLAGPTRPLGAPEIPQFYLPGKGRGVYTPMVYGSARIQFADRKRGVDETRRVAFLAPIPAVLKTLDWEQATPTDVQPEHLLPEAPGAATYRPLAGSAMQLNTFKRWARAFDRWLARTQRLELTTTTDTPETVVVGPKRGGVKVDLVAVVWTPGS